MPDLVAATTSIDFAARLRAAVDRISRRLRETRAGEGLTPTQVSVLFTIAVHGPLRLSELAQREGLNPTMLSRVVAQLAGADLVTRAPDPADGRAALVATTEAGARLRRGIRRERADVLAAHLRELSAEQRQSLAAALPAIEALAEQVKRSGARR